MSSASTMNKSSKTQTIRQRLFDIILNWSRERKLKMPKVLYTMVCEYYGKGDILIVFMDRLQCYNIVSPNSININPEIKINQLQLHTTHNKFTFRCSVVNREHNTNDVLFIGGFDEKQGVAVNHCQVYNINDNKFYSMSSCNNTRSNAQSVMYNKYECITIGGHQVEAIDSVELYSFKANSWTDLPSLPRKNVYFATASDQASGKVFVAGGQDSYGVHNMLYVLQKCDEDIDFEPEYSDKKVNSEADDSIFGLNEDKDVEAADKPQWKWTQLKNMIRYNYYCQGAYWDRYDNFLVLGGARRNRNVDAYDVYKDEWMRLPKSNYDHNEFSICSVWNDYIVWVGDDRCMSSIELFDRRMNQWISKEIAAEFQPPVKKARIWQWI